MVYSNGKEFLLPGPIQHREQEQTDYATFNYSWSNENLGEEFWGTFKDLCSRKYTQASNKYRAS